MTPLIITPQWQGMDKNGPTAQEDKILVINVNQECVFIDAEIWTGSLDKDGKPTGKLVLISQIDYNANLPIKLQRSSMELAGPACLVVRTFPTDNISGLGLAVNFTITPANPLSPPPVIMVPATTQDQVKTATQKVGFFENIKEDLESIKL